MTRLGEDDNIEEDADHDFLGVIGFFENPLLRITSNR